MPKKPSCKDPDPTGTNFLDYPESMSMYERESLAAESTLAEREKKSKPKKKKKVAMRVPVVPLKSVPVAESDKE